MIIRNKYLIIAATTATLATISACRQRIDPSEMSGTQIAPMACIASQHAATAQDQASKAPIDPTKAIELNFARMDQNAAGVYPAAYDMTKTIKGTTAPSVDFHPLTFAPRQYYTDNGKKTKMAAWYPALTLNGSIYNWVIDGTQDIITAIAQEGDRNNPMTNFVFNHQLTQLQFWLYTADAVAQNIWGKITKIEVLEQKNTATYTVATSAVDGLITFSGTATNSLTANNLTEEIPPLTEASAKQFGDAVMIEPQAAATYNLKIKIYSEKLPAGISSTISGALLKSTAYKVVLKFSGLEIVPLVSVTAWEQIDVDMQPNFPGAMVGPFGGWNEELGIFTRDLFVDRRGANAAGPNPGTADDGAYAYSTTSTVTGMNDMGNGWVNSYGKGVAINATYPAMQYCVAKNGSADPLLATNAGWYLPSQREMVGIWIAAPALPGYAYDGGAWAGEYAFKTAAADRYITSSEQTNTTAWVSAFTTGVMTTATKTTPAYARCVRSYPRSGQSVVNPVSLSMQDNVMINNSGLPKTALYGNGQSVPVATDPAWSKDNSKTNRVSRKYAVASADINIVPNSGGVGVGCPAGWRIPNQRELAQIWLLRTSMEKQGAVAGFAPMTGVYGSSTEAQTSSSSVWGIDFTPTNITAIGAISPKTTAVKIRCVKDDVPLAPAAVIINGTRWLTVNLAGTPGTKVGEMGTVALASKPEDKGMFFKWGTEKVYDRINSTTDGLWDDTGTAGAATAPATSSTDRIGYDYGIPSVLAGGEAPGDPCQKIGAIYRTPTVQQYTDLFDSRGGVQLATLQTLNNVEGAFFGPGAQNINTPQTSVPAGMIFLPAAGSRGWRDGSYGGEAESDGNYWSSSTLNKSNGLHLHYHPNSAGPSFAGARAIAMSVRCVIPQSPTVTIAGTKWLRGNLTASAQGATTGFKVEPTPQGLGYFWKWGSIYAYDRVSGKLPVEHWSDNLTGAATFPVDLSYGYDYATASGASPGGPAGDPCQVLGASYKTPTSTQITALHNSGNLSSTYKDVKGWFFGPSAASCNNSTLQADCIFLPAASRRDRTDGSLVDDDRNGYYWSSSVYREDGGWCMNFTYNNPSTTPMTGEGRGSGVSVRCIQE